MFVTKIFKLFINNEDIKVEVTMILKHSYIRYKRKPYIFCLQLIEELSNLYGEKIEIREISRTNFADCKVVVRLTPKYLTEKKINELNDKTITKNKQEKNSRRFNPFGNKEGTFYFVKQLSPTCLQVKMSVKENLTDAKLIEILEGELGDRIQNVVPSNIARENNNNLYHVSFELHFTTEYITEEVKKKMIQSQSILEYVTNFERLFLKKNKQK